MWNRPNKYSAKKETRIIDGKPVVFASKKEAERWDELRILARAGKIHDLRRQQRFVLIPAQRRDGKLLEQPCVYVADFTYTATETGEKVVEDVKGMLTPVYKIKRKLMLYVHGIQVREV